jgi:4a-hydroxytetrahydrobiopterin dehydratase
MSASLPDDAIAAALADLPGWARTGDELTKTFSFEGFREAVAFMVRLAFEAEQRDHHPRLGNVYDRVEVGLTTHDAGNTITQRDVDLARAIERVAG